MYTLLGRVHNFIFLKILESLIYFVNYKIMYYLHVLFYIILYFINRKK